MTVRSRFIKSVIATAKTTETDLPWARGSVRRKTAMRRSAQASAPRRAKSAAL